jgi:hypothetical protein
MLKAVQFVLVFGLIIFGGGMLLLHAFIGIVFYHQSAAACFDLGTIVEKIVGGLAFGISMWIAFPRLRLRKNGS